MRLVIIALISTATVAPAFAHVPSSGVFPTAVFERADQIGDALVSLDELRATRAKLFGRIDRNGDGVFDENDKTLFRRAEMEKRRAEIKRLFDADGDGAVSAAEFLDGPTPLFTQADTNGDDFLDQAEIAAARDAAAAQRQAGASQP